MCGRYTLTIRDDFFYFFGVKEDLSLMAPQKDMLPGTIIPTIVQDKLTNFNKLVFMKWGYLPPWYKEGSGYKPVINARYETISERPYFKKSWEEHRCIIPASGYYEWEHLKSGEKVMHTFWPPDNKPYIGLAGIYSFVVDPKTHLPTHTCAIITKPAEGEVAKIHDRMPMVVK